MSDRFLRQSSIKSNSSVTLVEDVLTPPWTEIILVGKFARSVNGLIGMIAPHS